VLEQALEVVTDQTDPLWYLIADRAGLLDRMRRRLDAPPKVAAAAESQR